MSGLGLVLAIAWIACCLDSQAERREAARRQWDHEQRMRDRGEWIEGPDDHWCNAQDMRHHP